VNVCVLEEFNGSTLFYEENIVRGILVYSFFGFWSWDHVRVLRRGDPFCFS
jgi:hypothetical protein